MRHFTRPNLAQPTGNPKEYPEGLEPSRALAYLGLNTAAYRSCYICVIVSTLLRSQPGVFLVGGYAIRTK